MKKILGLDLGTNSIGWAVINANQINTDNNNGFKNLIPISIELANSRIIPMDADFMNKYDNGESISQTAQRTNLRGRRRLLERKQLRRDRLHRVLNILDFLPKHYSQTINRYGKFIGDCEPKLAWNKNKDGKNQFIFIDTFNEMLKDFLSIHPELEGKKIPYDWTIYYLRKKALTKKISKQELAWIILNFNQKRGYYQLREDKNIDNNKEEKYYELKVVKIETDGKGKDDKLWYNVYLENGLIYRYQSKTYPNWEGKTKDFIVTYNLNKDGSYKKDEKGDIKYSIRAPKEEDWELIKIKTESDILISDKTVGCYIYDTLLHNPQHKIIGKLVRTVERKFYIQELYQILKKQKEYIKELNDKTLYERCITELYSTNENHRNDISGKDFSYLFINDILFYQRPLKNNKNLISDCPYESYTYYHKDKDGCIQKGIQGIKCIATSNPLFQEFRLWQFLSNLKIYQREKKINDKTCLDVDVTDFLLKSENDITNLFDWLNDRDSITQSDLLNYFFKKNKKEASQYRWNYVEDKKYPCNETRATILASLKNINVDNKFLTREREHEIWHLLYSIDDKNELKKALKKYVKTYQELPELFIEEILKIKPYEKKYGSYSAKAIKKLLPLMRLGKYWDINNINQDIKERITKIISGEYDENISERAREKVACFTNISQFKGLPLWLACYIVYNRHSETKDFVKWESPNDIDKYLKEFKQHSMRNPIVEQVVTETLRTVRDIWTKVGHIDEIHIEMGRNLKNPANKRKAITNRILDNEKTNMRIKRILSELAKPDSGVKNVRPHSYSQQEILRIYEEYALENLDPKDVDYKEISNISKNANPSKKDIYKYKLWLEQKYISPYTGEIIPLSKLFTEKYEIEHIIPQSRYFDDSLSNKVICESEVNKLKDRMLGYEFIQKHHGEKVILSGGKTVEIMGIEQFQKHVIEHFNGKKRKNLLLNEIPDDFIERQLNDSRYISKFVKGLLSNIVREKDENGNYEQEAISKNVITCTGAITDRLKKDWGINDVWNNIILPRFQRLNNITGTSDFTTLNREGHEIPNIPLTLQQGFNKKRIDHRHHAMDAIIIACTTRNHVSLLNNEAAHSKHNINHYQLSNLLRRKETIIVNGIKQYVFKEFTMPWDSFITDVKKILDNMIISFKQNIRIINKTTNYYTHFNNGKKQLYKQKGTNWSIRKPMHKDTVFGEVNLRMKKTVNINDAIKNPSFVVDKDLKTKLKHLLNKGYDIHKIKKYFEDNQDIWQDTDISKIEVYYYTKDTKDRYFATRKPLDTSFNKKKIDSITDTGIQKILLNHLRRNNDNPEIAFSPEGIDDMNRNIINLNEGKFHQPILKVRTYEKSNKFAVGQKGNKPTKFVEAAKGTNLYLAVYENEEEDKATGKITKKRTYATIPLNIVIERFKQGLSPAPKNENGDEPIFVISPNDLVYLPKINEKIDKNNLDYSRIYKFVSTSKKEGHFIPVNIAKPILVDTKFYNINELGSNNKAERAWSGEMIKEICVPIRMDRLGNIIEIGY